jgi:cytochrome c oxidase subunit IV
MRNPPVLISVIGFFAAIAGFAFLFAGLRFLGFDWFGIFGDLPQFEQAGFWGWLLILAGVLWLAAAAGLWALQPWAWVFAMVVAGLSLLEAFILFIQYPGSGLGFAASLMPLLIIVYLNSRAVKASFGLYEGTTAPDLD